jgi:dTDP-4-dehydrorhamnose reductase
LGQENIGLIRNHLDIPVVYISTAGIFDGKQEYYHDFDLPNPLSIYGKSKYYGELYTLRNVRKHYIFRAGWMMGGGIKKDKKFINKIFQQIKEGKKELFVVDDKLGRLPILKVLLRESFKLFKPANMVYTTRSVMEIAAGMKLRLNLSDYWGWKIRSGLKRSILIISVRNISLPDPIQKVWSI